MTSTTTSRIAVKVTADGAAERIDLGPKEASAVDILQDAVGGLFYALDATDPSGEWPPMTIWCNDEGLYLYPNEPNTVAAAVQLAARVTVTPLLGPVVFTGGVDADGNTLGLDPHAVTSIEQYASNRRAAAH